MNKREFGALLTSLTRQSKQRGLTVRRIDVKLVQRANPQRCAQACHVLLRQREAVLTALIERAGEHFDRACLTSLAYAHSSETGGYEFVASSEIRLLSRHEWWVKYGLLASRAGKSVLQLLDHPWDLEAEHARLAARAQEPLTLETYRFRITPWATHAQAFEQAHALLGTKDPARLTVLSQPARE